MQRRHELTSVPIELVRTLVVVAETRNYSEAGKKLSLTQPAITAQIKRLHTILGGTIFRKSGQGIELTPFGSEMLGFARQYIKANDELLAASRGNFDRQPIRLGISSLYAADYYAACDELGPLADTIISVSHSDELDVLFQNRQLDTICSLQPSDVVGCVCSWTEQLVWARSARFQAQPATPVPIISLPSTRTSIPIVQALKGHAVQYRVVATSPDLHARIEATRAGLGYTAIPERLIAPPLVKADEPFLPALEPLDGSIRSHLNDPDLLREMLARLTMYKPAPN